MADFAPWSEVAGHPDFQSLTPEDQVQARDQYFNDVVRPRVPEEDLGAAREQFVRDTSSTVKPAQKQRDLGSFTMDRKVDSDASTMASDFLSSGKVGFDTAAADLRELTGRIPLVGEKLKAAGDALDRTFNLQSPDVSLKNASKNFSPEYQESREKPWWDSKEHWFGSAWADPRSYTAGLVESLPEEAITMFPAMKLAKASYGAALLKTGSEKLAANAAARTAMIVGGASEGALAGAQSSRQVRDDIHNLPEDTLRQSDAVKGLMAQNMTFDQAVDQVANDAATKAFFLAGVTTGIFSGMGDRVLAKIIMGSSGGIAKRVIKGAVTEGVLEEFPQSYLQQVSQNYAMRDANKDQDLFDDALNQGLAGLAIGAVQGGAMTGAFGHNAKPSATQGAPLDSGDVLGRQQQPTQDQTATPATPPPGGGGIESMLADPKAIFAEVTRRPEILNTIQQALADSPEAQQAKPQDKTDLASAIKSIEADPKAIFAIATQRPDIYGVIAKAAAETNSLTDQGTAQQRTAFAEQGAAQKATDLAQQDQRSAQEKASQQDQAFTQRGYVEPTTEEKASPRGPAVATAMSLALEKAMERAGIKKREPAQSGQANTQTGHPTVADANEQVLGGHPADLSDGLIDYVARKGNRQARLVATAEANRREATRDAGPSAQDRPMLDKLFTKQKLDTNEKRRAMELGFGHQKANGNWAFTPRANAYRIQLREEQAQQRSATHVSDEALVERLNARTGRSLQAVPSAHVPVSADARAGVQVAQSFGKRVVWYTGEGGAGLVLPEDPDTIYVNVKSKQPHLVVIGHELLHTLRRTNQGVYSQLLARLKPVMQNVPEYRAWLEGELKKEGQTLTDEEIDDLSHEELIADFLGDHMMQPKFWTEVFRGQERSLVDKITNAMQLALEAIRMRLQIGGKRGFGTEQFIKDGDAVRSALAQAFNAWSRQQTEKIAGKATTVVKTATSAAVASREREKPKEYAVQKEPVRAKGVTVTAETKPSTKLDIGKTAAKLGTTKLQKYQKDALAHVFGDKGLSALREALGFERTQFSYVDGSGGYDASITPNVVMTVNGSIHDAQRLAKAWMYIFKQDAVPFFRADSKLLADPKAAVGYKLGFTTPLTPTQEQELFDTLRKQVHKDLGYTKTEPNEIVVVNFRGDDGKPFLDLTDQQLLDRMEAFVDGGRFPVQVESTGAFGLKGGYPYHDWQNETTGRALRESAAQGRPDLSKRLDRWADSFRQFAEQRSETITRSGRRAAASAAGDRANVTPKEPLKSRERVEIQSGERRAAEVDQAAHEAATSPKNGLPEPSAAQIEANNYKHGHVRISGLDITIENPEGSERTFTKPNGETGSKIMRSHYGYIKGTVDRTEEHIDVFVHQGTPKDYAGPVFVIDQRTPKTGKFDEYKVMLGWHLMKDAKLGYMENYQKGWDGIKAISRFDNPEAFKRWLEDGDTKKPAAEQAALQSRERGPMTRKEMILSDRDYVNLVMSQANDAQLIADAAREKGDENKAAFFDAKVVEHRAELRMLREQEKAGVSLDTSGLKAPTFLSSREERPWGDSGHPGAQFSVRLEMERRANGDWSSPDGRYEVVREVDGYYAKVDGLEVGWGRDFQRARSYLTTRFNQEVESGKIKNPDEAKSVFNKYTIEQTDAVTKVWEKIASMQGAFRFAKTEANDPKAIAKDLGVDRVMARMSMYPSANTKSSPSGSIDIHFIDGTRGYIHFDNVDGDAYVDASEMNQGGFGAQLYQLALTWAANNKMLLKPDPGGVTYINTFRRTEQMASAALRLGTTQYMLPHRDQGLYGWIKNATTKSEYEHNIALLFLSSYDNMMVGDADHRGKVIERLRDLRYNFSSQKFEDPEGKAVPNDWWRTLSGLDHESTHYGPGGIKSFTIGGGVTTLQRAVLTQSILAEAANRSGAGLAALVSHVPSNAILDGEHPLRAVLYSRQRDTGGRPLAESSGSENGGAVRRFALGTARAAVSATRPLTAALDLANRGADAILKVPAKLLVAPITSRLYDRVVGIGHSLAKNNAFAQEVAHGLIADYGLPEPYLDARQDRESNINKVLRQSKEMLDRIASLDRAEARVAYTWMQESPNTQAEQQLLAQLPEESRQTLAQMKEQIDKLGQEAVKQGLLSPESFERNRMAYLHRTYKKYEMENPGKAAGANKAKAIRADAYRGRGLRDDVAASRLPGVQQGDKYLRLEERSPSHNGELGGLMRVVYLPAGTPISQTYAGWRHDGVWEARFMPSNPQDGGKVGMWRDLSPEERARLGEIDEVRYAFARTMLATTRDIETARFLGWTQANYGKSEVEVEAAGGRIAEAVDQKTTLQTYADNDWVKVPSGYAQGTKIPKYGALAGTYIPGHLWNDIRSTINFRSDSAVWRLYDQLLRGWKMSKTALSPAVHTNNVMSNFILADMADTDFEDIRVGLRTIIDAQRGDEASRAMMERFYDSGAEGASQAAIELRTEVIEPFLKELENEQDETLRKIGIIQAISLGVRGNLRQSIAALSAMKVSTIAAKPFNTMIEAYREEDTIFRLGKFLHEINRGTSDRDAGRMARRAILDYNINAPWVQALRRGPLPFLSFSYRAIPLLIETAAKRPWKLMKYFGVGYALNALAYSLLGSGGDEDKERKLMPDEKSGRALGVFYRMLRMPWNDEQGSPVFMDVRRWIPGGDIVDLNGSQAAVPLPSWLSVGGPLSLFVEMIANKDLFTGKPIVKDTDTVAEKIVKITDHLAKFIMPNVPLPNPVGYVADAAFGERGLYQTYSWKSIQAAGTGETDAFGRERNLAQALAASGGVKIGAQPADVARSSLSSKRDAELREIGENVTAYRREHQRGGLTDEEYKDRVSRQNEKRQDIMRKFGDRVGLERINP